MPTLLYDYKELTACISEVERIETNVYTKNKGLMIMEEDEEKEVSTVLISITKKIKK